MIGVEARGRLGNQMFQFAFGLAAAQQLDTDFAMSDTLLRRYFELRPWGAPLRRLERSVRYRSLRRLAPLPVVKVDAEAEPATVLATLADRTHYAGFFQSAEYFASGAGAVRRAFQPRRQDMTSFRTQYARLLERPYICCHVRRTDYVSWLGGVALPISYYEESLRRADPDASMAVVFVGDDLDEVEGELGGRPGVRLERNAELVDLLLLVHAHTVVTSNSSFGWWGSWLGRPGRRIYAPRGWLGFKDGDEWPRGVIPPTWTQVAVIPAAR